MLGLVLRVTRSNGLLVEQSTGRYAFVHRSLQELLAGLHVLTCLSEADIADMAMNMHWRASLLLAAQSRRYRGEGATPLTRIARSISHPDGDVIMAGELFDVIGREVVDANAASLWTDTANALCNLAETNGTDTAVRVRALSVLGRLGDPRFLDANGMVKSDNDRVITLSPLVMTVGTITETVPKGEKGAPANPLRRVEFDSFGIGRYPVTNLEYARFVNGNGYEEPRYWRGIEASAWARGDEALIGEIVEISVSRIEKDLGPELREVFRGNRQRAIDELWRICSRRNEPYWWRDSRFNHPTQPVVGVGWWEANAYCAWLTEDSRASGVIAETQTFVLPSEWEWERACADDTGQLSVGLPAWKNLGSRAHTRVNDLAIDRPVPVGAFPSGAAAAGLDDLIGNVWEWTRSRAVPYDVSYDNEREVSDGLNEYVARGGSWFARPWQLVSPCFRTFDLPWMVYFDVGFRVTLRD